MTPRALDRRSGLRGSASVYGVVSARVRPGHDAVVIDVSAGGTLIEVTTRLLPGAAVEIHFEAADRRTTISGRIVRCAIVRLASCSVSYRAAIAFDRQMLWFAHDQSSGYAIPSAEGDPQARARVEPTQDAV